MRITTKIIVGALCFMSYMAKGQSQLMGKVMNRNSDSLVVSNVYGNKVQVLKLDAQGGFKSSEVLKKGFYTLSDGSEQTQIYLEPNYKLILNLDSKTFDESIKYSGNGSEENNYLAQKYLYDEQMGGNALANLLILRTQSVLDEKAFVNFVDSIHDLRMHRLLERDEKLGEEFVTLESYALQIDRSRVLLNYGYIHGMITKNPEFKVSDQFPKVFEENLVLDSKYLALPQFTAFVDDWVRDDVLKAYNQNPKADFLLLQLKVILEKVKDEKI